MNKDVKVYCKHCKHNLIFWNSPLCERPDNKYTDYKRASYKEQLNGDGNCKYYKRAFGTFWGVKERKEYK